MSFAHIFSLLSEMNPSLRHVK